LTFDLLYQLLIVLFVLIVIVPFVYRGATSLFSLRFDIILGQLEDTNEWVCVYITHKSIWYTHKIYIPERRFTTEEGALAYAQDWLMETYGETE
jgi:hypothetical protein